jgi:hypothetical protein
MSLKQSFAIWFLLQVAMAMAAKAKLLLRELKTVKADLAFAKDRCAQLEEENKILRVNRERGDNQDDDDLVCILFFLADFLFFSFIMTLVFQWDKS